MPRRTTTSFALLGLLRVQDWTTYELAKQAQRSLHWFWPRAERKLYDEPKFLVSEGLASAQSHATGKRPKTVYGITADGRRALKDWLDEPAAPRSSEFEAMIKVFFADAGDLDQLRTNLDRIEAEALEGLRELTAMAAGPVVYPERVHLSALTLPLRIEQERTVLRWVRWAREQVETWASTTDPADWDSRAALDALVASLAGDL